MKTYTIVVRVNGCGKSSLTGVLRTELHDLGQVIDGEKNTAACGGNLLYPRDCNNGELQAIGQSSPWWLVEQMEK